MDVNAQTVLDAALEPIREKVVCGRRLSWEDGVTLYRSRDIFTIGALANHVRERLHGRRAYYNINRHINYSNYCVLRCKFCSFYRPYPKSAAAGADQGGAPPAVDGGYEFSLEEIIDQAAAAHERGATEVHIVGGLHPKLPFAFYTEMCRAIKQRCPRMHIKAFTAIEIVHFTRITRPRMSIEQVLAALHEAGLDSLPGGGAEIFDDRVHDEAFTAKVGEKHWFDVHRAAHELGIPSNATMLYGHIETVEERITHLVKLREHQDESLARNASERCQASGDRRRSASEKPVTCHLSPVTGESLPASGDSISASKAAFQCCIPLSFIPEGSALHDLPGPTGLDDLKTLAIARLMLDNFPHIKAFWPMQSSKLSQVALNWGVDDFDGTVVWYDITKREGRGTNRQELTVDQIRRLIREAGCQPVERDTLYRPVRRGGAPSVMASDNASAFAANAASASGAGAMSTSPDAAG